MAGYLLNFSGRRGVGGVLLATVFCILTILPRLSSAAPIVTYEATDLTDSVFGDDRWNYLYSVHGPLPAFSLVEIIFDASFYKDLTVTANSAGVVVFSTDPFAGVLDGLVDITPFPDIPSGSYETVSVDFTWLGSGVPGSQELLEFDFLSFNLVPAGQTSPAAASVPEPPLILLLATGCLLLASRRLVCRSSSASTCQPVSPRPGKGG